MPGASRSFTELQLSSSGGLEPDRRGGWGARRRRPAPRDPGGRTRSGDGPDGQTERSDPLSILLVGGYSGYLTERGLTAEDLSATLPGGPSGAAAIHLIARAQLVPAP